MKILYINSNHKYRRYTWLYFFLCIFTSIEKKYQRKIIQKQTKKKEQKTLTTYLDKLFSTISRWLLINLTLDNIKII